MSVSERWVPEKLGNRFAWDCLIIATWSVALATIMAAPYLTASPTLGDDLIRNTVRLSLGFYAVAVSIMLLSRDRMSTSSAGRLARLCWTLAWAAYLVHLAMAFHHYHHWSHADAVRHTRQVSGIGEGIYVSHFFTVLWTIDVAFWWLRSERYAMRSAKLIAALHAFMAFVIFCGTVVYESGPIRWLGVTLFAWLAFVWLFGRPRTGVTISEKRS